jgi:hypothetical protein
MPEDTRPPFVENGLSYRANGLLQRAGIPAEKPAVRHALQTGALVPGKDVRLKHLRRLATVEVSSSKAVTRPKCAWLSNNTRFIVDKMEILCRF